jgi:hypothetical protein
MKEASLGRTMNGLVLGGALLVLLGLVGISMPMFNTHHTEDVAKVGDLKVQSTETTPHVIPPIVSEGALVLGVVLIGAGLFKRA